MSIAVVHTVIVRDYVLGLLISILRKQHGRVLDVPLLVITIFVSKLSFRLQ
jgi:hypothetical protein